MKKHSDCTSPSLNSSSFLKKICSSFCNSISQQWIRNFKRNRKEKVLCQFEKQYPNCTLTDISSKQCQDLNSCLLHTKAHILNHYTIFVCYHFELKSLYIILSLENRTAPAQIKRTYMSGVKPSTLKANQAASLAPFPQAHAQNLALLISDDVNGQDKK